MKKNTIILLLAITSLISCGKSDEKLADSNLEKNASVAKTDVADQQEIPVNSEKELVDSDLNNNISETKPTASDKPISPTVKGLHLGMAISDASTICRSLLKEYIAEIESEVLPQSTNRIKDKIEFTELTLTEAPISYDSIGGLDNNGKYFQLVKHSGYKDSITNKTTEYTLNLLTVESDSNNKVIRIFISLEIIKHLFNSKEIANEEFARKFINAYGIPQLEVYTIPKTTLGAWRYTEANKYIITIIPAPSQFGGKWGGGDVVMEVDSVKSQGDFN
jgi:hypothetical protein